MTLLLGAFGTAAGAWTNVMSVAPDRFYVAMMGQTLSATAQVFLLGVVRLYCRYSHGPMIRHTDVIRKTIYYAVA